MTADRDPLNNLIDQLRIRETMDGTAAAHDDAVYAITRLLNNSRDPHALIREARAKAEIGEIDRTATAYDLTRQIRADLRSLNHLGSNGQGYTHPSDVYDAVGDFAAIVALLPQAFQYADTWLKRQWRAGRVRSVNPAKPAAQCIHAFGEWMRAAGGVPTTRENFMRPQNDGTAGKLHSELNKAWTAINSLAVNDPTTDPVPPAEIAAALTGDTEQPTTGERYRDVVVTLTRQHDGTAAGEFRDRRSESDIPAAGSGAAYLTEWATRIVTGRLTVDLDHPHPGPGGYNVTVQIETDHGHRWADATMVL